VLPAGANREEINLIAPKVFKTFKNLFRDHTRIRRQADAQADIKPIIEQLKLGNFVRHLRALCFILAIQAGRFALLMGRDQNRVRT
jgi:hypothetical protein